MKTLQTLLIILVLGISYVSTAYGGIDDGLVAYYPFNGNANDESGNDEHGTPNGATLTTDKFGNPDSAYNFNGSSCIDFPQGGGVGNASTFTAWFNSDELDSGDGSGHWILNWRPDSGDSNEIRLIEDAKITAVLVNNGGSHSNGYKRYVGNTSLQINTWYHAAMSWDGTNLRLYLNGIEDTPYLKVSDNPLTMHDSIRNKRAGATTIDISSHASFRGKIDEIRIYNRALSESEIQALYNSTTSPPPAITDISPLTGSKVGDTEVTITGTDFQDGATVKFGDINATSVTFNSSTELIATTPSITGNTPINVTVRVTNLDEQYADFATQFEYLTAVWPGDTNNDGIVDQNDVSPIGTHWGLTGAARTNASIQWTEQLTSDWTTASTTYVDASGNGTINQGDVLRIGYNWAETNSNYNPAPALIALNGNNSNLPPLKAIAPSVVKPDERFTVQIQLGETDAPVDGLFGVAFRLQNRLPQMVKAVEATPDSLLGNNLVFFQHIDENEGYVSVGMTKKRGQNPAQGNGTVAKIDFMASKKAKLGTRVSLAFTDAAVNNSTGERIKVNPQSSDFIIGYLGDVTCDAKIDASDAREVLQMTVSGSSPYEKGMLADVSGDGTVSPFDAVLILQHAEGMRPNLPAEVGETVLAPKLASSPRMSIPPSPPFPKGGRGDLGRFDGKVGKNISVPVDVDVAGLMSGQMNLTFDERLLKVLSVTQGEMIKTGELTYHAEGEKLHIAFANPKAIEGKGILFNVDFEIQKSSGIASDATVIINWVQLNDVELPIQFMGRVHLLPSETRLLHNYPNPFNPETWIPYQLATDTEDVSIVIYNLGGQIVRTLRLGSRSAGMYLSKERAAHWDGRNQQGERVASGIYIYHFRADNYQAIRKMVIRK